MKTSRSSKLFFRWTALLSLALVAGAATGSPLHAPATPDEAAAPVLDPAVYHHVAQVIWVVKDVDSVVDYWQRLGIHNIHRDGIVSFPNLTYRGKPDPARAKRVTAKIDQLEIKWIQPIHGGKFWHDCLRKHGDGIRALGYAARFAAGV